MKIDPNVQPIRSVSPYKRIDVSRPGRKLVIRREDVKNDVVREPDLALYDCDLCNNNYVLKEKYR